MVRSGKHPRRAVLVTIGAGVVTGIGSGRRSATNDEAIELVDVDWTVGDFGLVEVEATIRNESGEEASVDLLVRVFEDDTLLDDVTLLFFDVPDGVEASERLGALDLEPDDLERVTHWQVSVDEDPLVNGDETTYEFDGPIDPNEDVAVEDATVLEDEQ